MEKIKAFINRTSEKFKDSVFLFRFISLILALDIVAFFILTSTNPFSVLNPFSFIGLQNRDNRPKVVLYFPGSTISRKKKENVNQSEKSNLPDLVKIEQKVFQTNPTLNTSNNTEEDKTLEENISSIMQSLIAGPTSLKARRFLPNVFAYRKMWVQNQLLILHLNPELFKGMDSAEKLLAKEAIRRSILGNIKKVNEVMLID